MREARRRFVPRRPSMLRKIPWSPCSGMGFRGRLTRSPVRGREVFADGVLKASPGDRIQVCAGAW
jgi:hypothetical protein